MKKLTDKVSTTLAIKGRFGVFATDFSQAQDGSDIDYRPFEVEEGKSVIAQTIRELGSLMADASECECGIIFKLTPKREGIRGNRTYSESNIYNFASNNQHYYKNIDKAHIAEVKSSTREFLIGRGKLEKQYANWKDFYSEEEMSLGDELLWAAQSYLDTIIPEEAVTEEEAKASNLSAAKSKFAALANDDSDEEDYN